MQFFLVKFSNQHKKYFGIALVAFLLLAYFPLFYRLDTLTLGLWDEARRGVNAMEMAAGESHVLVPTFDGSADRWGTKPPMLIWLQAGFIKLLGPSELAVRLPAALAGLATVLAMIWFGMRVLKTPWVGILAGMVLLTSNIYIGSHATRTGDFDALLVLWETCFALSFFQYLQARKNKHLYFSALFLLLAGWTKGIAAFFFLPGIALFTVLFSSTRFIWTKPRVYLVFLACLFGVLSYYGFREIYDPGFLAAVWDNELGGRYFSGQEGHSQRWYFYLRVLWEHALFNPWLWLLPFGIGLAWRVPTYRVFTQYLLALSLVLLAIISISATKLIWYMLPVFPLLSLIMGMGLVVLAESLLAFLSHQKQWFKYGVTVVCLIGLFFLPYYSIIQKVSARAHTGPIEGVTHYANFIDETKTFQPVTIISPRFNPHIVFYQQKAKREGHAISLEYLSPPEQKVDATPNTINEYLPGNKIMVCEMASWQHMADNYQFKELLTNPPCKLLEVQGKK